jgi:hypothetical protein
MWLICNRPFARVAWFCVASVCGFVKAADRGETPSLALAPDKTPQACFEVRGLPPEIATQLQRLSARDPRWSAILSVRVTSNNLNDRPPMLGSYEARPDGVRFRPRFPLERGIKYRAVFDWPAVGGSQNSSGASQRRLHLAETFSIPISHSGAPSRVVGIYPSGRELPENLLRMYIQFSAPMTQGNCYRRLHLRDETSGTEVQQPFLELPQELWSADGTRLTLLLEPGRVKHDLVPREDLGPILVAGRSYSLTVDATWPDAEGRPLGARARKVFRAAKADVGPLDPHMWAVEAPAAGTRDSLSIRFPRPLDRALLERVLRVLGPGEAEIAGAIHIADDETRWAFEPHQPWATGRYVVAVSTRLEDPAGNRIGRPFEVDLKQSSNLPPVPAVVRIEFAARRRP